MLLYSFLAMTSTAIVVMNVHIGVVVLNHVVSTNIMTGMVLVGKRCQDVVHQAMLVRRVTYMMTE